MHKRRLSFELLADWVDGRLDDETSLWIQAQLPDLMPAQQADLAWLRAFARLRVANPLPPPPAALRQTLTERFNAFAADRRVPGFIERLVAVLSFDSRGAVAAAGVRSAASEGMARQLIFATEVADVALNLQPRSGEDNWDIVGQVFANDDRAEQILSVQLLQNGREVSTTVTDDLGEFVIAAVAPLVFDMVVSSDQFEMNLHEIDIRA